LGYHRSKFYDDITLKDKPHLNENSEKIERTKERVKFVFSHHDLAHFAVKEIFRLSVEHRSRNNIVIKDIKLNTNKKNPIIENRNVDFLKILNKKKIKLPEIPSVVSELNEVISNPRNRYLHSLIDVRTLQFQI
jgi:hypothetical protein